MGCKMVARQQQNGWPIIFFAGKWWYEDGELATNFRPCPKCGELPTLEGHDACLGEIAGVWSACCGHGIKPKYIKKLDAYILRINNATIK